MNKAEREQHKKRLLKKARKEPVKPVKVDDKILVKDSTNKTIKIIKV